jgi:hypothetical protein
LLAYTDPHKRAIDLSIGQRIPLNLTESINHVKTIDISGKNKQNNNELANIGSDSAYISAPMCWGLPLEI